MKIDWICFFKWPFCFKSGKISAIFKTSAKSQRTFQIGFHRKKATTEIGATCHQLFSKRIQKQVNTQY